jgi:hypothetical protein
MPIKVTKGTMIKLKASALKDALAGGMGPVAQKVVKKYGGVGVVAVKPENGDDLIEVKLGNSTKRVVLYREEFTVPRS